MRSLPKTAALSLAALLFSASLASAGASAAGMPAAQAMGQPYMVANAVVPPRLIPKTGAAEQPQPFRPYDAEKANTQKQPAKGDAATQSGQYKPLLGNPAAKVYHARGCRYYDPKSATVGFADAREAEKAGYRACRICEGKEGTSAAARQPQDQPPSGDAVLRGNPDTGYLHGPSCRFYDSRNATVTYTSAEQAKKDGFRLCPICGGK